MTNISFLSLNLWEGGQLPDTYPFIKRINADVMCLQEAINGSGSDLPERLRSIEVLKKLFPDYHYHFTPEVKKMEPEGSFDFGNLIVSKYPIISTDEWFFDKPYKNDWKEGIDDTLQYPSAFQKAVLEVNGVLFSVFNVHGIWGYDGHDNPRRDVMGQMIMQELSGCDHVIMSGDFNLFPDTQVVANIEEILINVFKDELSCSFNMKHKFHGNYATSVVDMMFVSKNIGVVSHECVDVDVSDHLPLIATFEY